MNESAAARKPAEPKWTTEAKDAIRTGIKKFQKPLTDLVQRDANEGDTRLLVTDFLCDALGYDKFEDLTTEFASVLTSNGVLDAIRKEVRRKSGYNADVSSIEHTLRSGVLRPELI